MRKTLVILVAAMTVAMTVPAFAELQNVQVGGALRIRASWFHDGLFTNFDNDAIGANDSLFVEQRTKVNVSADFTKDVHAFIELDSWNLYGDGFRGLDSAGGNYALTGYDASALNSNETGIESGTPVNLYQAYVEIKEGWGYPIFLKVGRSEMQHGDEFLIGNNDTSSLFRGLSFDGVWAGYKNDQFNITGFWTRPYTDASSFVGFGDDSADINFSGIYGSYTGIENMSIDAYYYYYHGSVVGLAAPGNESQAFSTVGLRFAGNRSQFDWALNGAYQFGDAGFTGVDVNAFALQGTAGYTFDVKMQPHLFINGAYYDAADVDANGNVTEVAFNRLFSDHEYSEFIDATDMSNFWNVGLGVSAQVTEAINLKALGNYFQTVDTYAPGASDSLGFEVELIARYNYSEDLYFEAGYSHLFAGSGFGDAGGAVIFHSGSVKAGNAADQSDDQDYVYVETGIKF